MYIFNMRSTLAKLALVGVAATVACLYMTSSSTLKNGTSLQALDKAFTTYLAKYGKSYGTKEEYEYRRELFEQNLMFIADQNAQNDGDYRIGLNKFSDMNEYEL